MNDKKTNKELRKLHAKLSKISRKDGCNLILEEIKGTIVFIPILPAKD